MGVFDVVDTYSTVCMYTVCVCFHAKISSSVLQSSCSKWLRQRRLFTWLWSTLVEVSDVLATLFIITDKYWMAPTLFFILTDYRYCRAQPGSLPSCSSSLLRSIVTLLYGSSVFSPDFLSALLFILLFDIAQLFPVHSSWSHHHHHHLSLLLSVYVVWT